jgi:DNA-binding transcriptional LysR family regulator
MIECSVLEERHVELVGHQRIPDVRRELWMSLDRRQVSRTAAFIGNLPLGPHTQCECRVMVEEERRGVIVVDYQQHIRALLLEPYRQRCEVLKDRHPRRVVALFAIEREADSRRVRGGDATDDTFEQNGLAAPAPVVMVNSTLALTTLISEGDYVGLMPMPLPVHSAAANFMTVVPIKEGHLAMTVGAIVRRGATLKPAVRHFLAHLHRATHQARISHGAAHVISDRPTSGRGRGRKRP